jgi:hypothetical protein
MTDTIPRSRGDGYALSALKQKRAGLASEIVQTERHLRHLKESLVHVDATLLLLDPAGNPEAIPNKRLLPQRIKLFRQGELGRMILGVLRDAQRELSTAEIVSGVLAAGEHGEDARPAMAPRVRGNLAYLERRGVVRKSGNGEDGAVDVGLALVVFYEPTFAHQIVYRCDDQMPRYLGSALAIESSGNKLI